MLEEFQIRPIPLQYDASKEELRAFLRRHELALEDDVEAAFGIFNSHDELSGCGCAAGSLLKCFAVSSELRGQNALGLLLSALVQDRFLAGLYDLFVITRAHNETLFANCGFWRERPRSSCWRTAPTVRSITPRPLRRRETRKSPSVRS